ncbi:MAG: ABC transporter ATP-binding protein/permease [Actinomycetota bacterium]|nr:ABC transporter ATP-binding protein/permease [Actinomycetota bacterium]
MRLGRLRRLAGILLLDGFRAAPGPMTIAAAMMLLGAVASVTYPLGIRIMVDALVHHDSAREAIGVALVAALFTLSWALAVAGATQGARLTDRMLIFLTARIATLVNRVPGISHLERPDYLLELDQLEEQRRMLASGPQQALTLAQIVAQTLGIVVLLGLVYTPLALLPLVGLPPFLGDKRSVTLRERSDADLAPQRRLAAALFTLSASAAPAKELRVFGLANELLARHASLSAQLRSATTRAAVRGASWSAAGWILYALAFAGAIALIALRAAHHEASLGQVVLAVSLLRRAQLSVSRISDAIGRLLTSARAAGHLTWLEDHARQEQDKGGGNPAPDRLEHGIELRGVSFTYPGTEHEVLRGVDAFLPAGSSVAIVGENGAGKTTLVKLLTGMYESTSGALELDGVPLSEISLDNWRQRTSAVFQDHARYDLLASQAVGVGSLPLVEDRPAVGMAMERAGAATLIGELPAGLETPLGRSFRDGHDLSHGQWQKLALARGMMRKTPLLLILDEPTASLDAPTETALFDRYADASQEAAASVGAITLLISHRFSTVRMADLILVLEGGVVAERGDHASLIAHGGLYAELFELQARGYR